MIRRILEAIEEKRLHPSKELQPQTPLSTGAYDMITDQLRMNGWTLNMVADEGYHLDGDDFANTDEPGGLYWERWKHPKKDPGQYVELTWQEVGPVQVSYMASPGKPSEWEKVAPDEQWMNEMLNAVAEW